jgi:hypothetical protein
MDPNEGRNPLDGLGRAADRIPAASTDGVVGRVAQRRVRRQRRRRALTATGATAVVVLAVAGALAIPGLGDDEPSEVRTADPSADPAAPIVLPAEPSFTRDIAVDGGAVWVLVSPPTEPESPSSPFPSSLVRVDVSSGEPTMVTELPIYADWITTTDGAVWATGSTADAVVRVDAATGDVAATVPLRLDTPVCDPAVCGEEEAHAFLPNSLATAGGRVWVSTARGTVVGIDPASDTITSTASIEGDVPGGGAGTDSAYWVSVSHLGIIRVDATAGTTASLPIAPEQPAHVVLDVQATGDHVLAEVAEVIEYDEDTDATASPASTTVVLDDGGQVVDEVARGFHGVAGDAEATWVVDEGYVLRRLTDIGDLADPSVGAVLPLTGSGPATVADGA